VWSVSSEGGRTQEDICGFYLKEDAILMEVRFVCGPICCWLAPSPTAGLHPQGRILRSAQGERFRDLLHKENYNIH
jgi:hypothetical protein